MESICPKCGAPIDAGSNKCEYCGAVIQTAAPAATAQAQPQVQQIIVNNNGINTSMWPVKNKIVAAILAIVLGCFGVHEFYLGRNGKGIFMLLFCWTGIPAIVGFIQGIFMLVSTDENFQLKYRCRLQ